MVKALFAGISLIFAVSAQAQNEFTIKGTVTGLKDSTVIMLFRSDGQVMSSIAQDTVFNESFCFREKTAEDKPEAVMLMARDKDFPNTWLDVWVAPNAVCTVSGNNKLLRTWDVSSNIKEQQILNRYKQATFDETNLDQELSIERMKKISLLRSGNLSAEDSDKLKKEMAEVEKKQDSVRHIISKKEIGIMQQTPVETIWMDKLRGLSMEMKYMKDFPYKKEVFALYEKLSNDEKQSAVGKEISVYLYPPVTVKTGDEMADADLYDLEGNVHHLADYKGKYLLIDFWSRGCGPCMMALPEMKEISETMKDKVTVISLSTDTEKGWKEISKTKDMSWVNLNDFGGMSGLAAKYDVRGIPHYVIISPEGIILHSWSGYSKGLLKRKLNKWVNKANRVMSVKKEGNTTIIEFPIEKSSNTETVEINKIELTGTETVFHMKAFNAPGYWVSISKDTYLKTENGTHFTLKSADGITPDERFTMPESGEQAFKLYFPPLPAGTKTVDFIESDCDSCFKILGLPLTNE